MAAVRTVDSIWAKRISERLRGAGLPIEEIIQKAGIQPYLLRGHVNRTALITPQCREVSGFNQFFIFGPLQVCHNSAWEFWSNRRSISNAPHAAKLASQAYFQEPAAARERLVLPRDF